MWKTAALQLELPHRRLNRALSTKLRDDYLRRMDLRSVQYDACEERRTGGPSYFSNVRAIQSSGVGVAGVTVATGFLASARAGSCSPSKPARPCPSAERMAGLAG